MWVENTHASEVKEGARFQFGANWVRFLATLNDDRIALAEQSLHEMLGDIRGKRFLDAGSGSGLFSSPRTGSARTFTASTTIHSRSHVPRNFGRDTHRAMRNGQLRKARCLMQHTSRGSGRSMSYTRGAFCTTRGT